MPPISRLLLPPDTASQGGPLPAPERLHPASLDLTTVPPRVVIGSGGGWRLPVTATAQAPIMAAFAPQVDGLGRLHQRRCLAMVGLSSTHLIVDLVPQAGPRLTVPLSPLDASTVAAMLTACLTLPAPAATYEVRPGDTLSSICRQIGPTTNWRTLYRLNRRVVSNPHHLIPGTVLQVPDVPARDTVAPSGHRIVVRAGDTLYSLAKRHLGDGKRWPELVPRLPQHLTDPSRLPVGMVIALPDTIASHSDGRTATNDGTTAIPVPPLPAMTPPPESAHPETLAADRPTPSPLPELPITPIQDPSPAMIPVAPLAPIPVAPIERPLASRIGLSFNPVTYHEAIVPQQVTARGTILAAFGTDAAWRLTDWLQLAGQYHFNGYPLTRSQPTGDSRIEHRGDVTAYLVWPLLPHLELAAGLGGQWTAYAVTAKPPVDRPQDLYDSGYQRWLGHADAVVGWRPWPDRPLTLTAGLQAVPVGRGYRLDGVEPQRLWGVGWSAGIRYSLNGLALETSYRGLRLFGDGYGQSADQLQTGVAYYFR